MSGSLGGTRSRGGLGAVDDSSDPASGPAPADAEYWVGAANGDLTAEKNLGALNTGLVKNTGGVPSIGVAGTDYLAPSNVYADWDLGTVRYYAVDYLNGNDNNVGYSDVSMAASGLVALKTLERLRQILPGIGQGRRIAITIAGQANNLSSLTYLKQDGITVDDADFRCLGNGYRGHYIRTTQNFADNATDRTTLAPVIRDTGPNADGSWTVAAAPAPTVNTFSVAAGSLAATSHGFRVRFKGNVTAALANQCRNIWKPPTTSEIVLGLDASVAPAAGDEFFIEEPGVIVNQFYSPQGTCGGNGTSFAQTFTTNVAGFSCLQTAAVASFISGADLQIRTSFMKYANRLSIGNITTFSSTNTYFSPDATNVNVGSGSEWTTNSSSNLLSGSCTGQFIIEYGAMKRGTATSTLVVRLLGSCGIGAGQFFSTSMLFQGGKSAGGHGIRVGNGGTAGAQRGWFQQGANIQPGNCTGIEVRGCDFNGNTTACILFQSLVWGSLTLVDDCVSTNNDNTGVFVDVAGYGKNVVVFGRSVTNTVAPTTGYIRDSAGALIANASLSATETLDSKYNSYIKYS